MTIISHTISELLVIIEFYFNILLKFIVNQLSAAGKSHYENILYKIKNTCLFKTLLKTSTRLIFLYFLKKNIRLLLLFLLLVVYNYVDLDLSYE